MKSFFQMCLETIFHGAIMLALGFVVFTLAERVFSINKAKKALRESILDLQYAFLSMLYPPFLYFVISAVFGFVAASNSKEISATVFALNVLGILLANDCLIYIRHRISTRGMSGLSTLFITVPRK